MSTTDTSPRLAKALVLGVAIGLVVVVTGGLLLRAYAPGRMWLGFIVGGAISIGAIGFAGWRRLTHPERTTSAERSLVGQGDERDQAVARSATATLGAFAIPLTTAAVIALAVGAPVAPVAALLLWSELLVLVAAFVVIERRT